MHEPPFYEFVDALTSLVTIASSPLNFDAEPDSIESIDSSRFRFIRSGDARLYFIRNFKYFDSIDTKLQLFEGWKKRFDREKNFSRFIISLNLIRIKGKKRKKILKNTFDHFNRNSNTGDKDAHHLNERMERKKEGEGEEE